MEYRIKWSMGKHYLQVLKGNVWVYVGEIPTEVMATFMTEVAEGLGETV